MLCNQRVELRCNRIFAAAVQVGLNTVLDRDETQCVQPASDRRDPLYVSQV